MDLDFGIRSYQMSHYNVLTFVPEEQKYLLYNINTGGLEVLGLNEGNYLKSLSGKKFSIEDDSLQEKLLTYLMEKNYIVSSEADERLEYQKSREAKRKSRVISDVSKLGLTVGTTITCNMACPYCFEVRKPKKTLRDQAVIEGIIRLLDQVVDKAPVKTWQSLRVVWYGGEPLINGQAIETLTPKLVAFSKRNNLEYKASIITNGILLNEKNWQILKENHVDHVQVTIDGTKETHNKSRPLKSNNDRNYEQILENLRLKPNNISLTIRVNVDREIAKNFERFFLDLESYGIWPQQHRSVTIAPAWLRTYEEAGETDVKARLTQDEFFDVHQEFRMLKLKWINSWRAKNGLRLAKLKWELPEKVEDCPTWASPYHFVIDPEGDVHKCWETIHDSEQRVTNVAEEYKIANFQEYIDYDRTKLHDVCYNCKYLPVCEGLSCQHAALATLKNNQFPCTSWKTKTEAYISSQFLFMQQNPDKIAFPKELVAGNGHEYR